MFRLDIRKNVFTEDMVKYWNRIPSKIVDAPCLSVFKRHLVNVLSVRHGRVNNLDISMQKIPSRMSSKNYLKKKNCAAGIL